MTSVSQLRKELRQLKQQVTPKPKRDIVVIFSFGPDDEPHGKYGYRKVHMNTGEVEACTEEEELEMMKEYYDNLDVKFKKKVSFEQFCKQNECTCGQHK